MEPLLAQLSETATRSPRTALQPHYSQGPAATPPAPGRNRPTQEQDRLAGSHPRTPPAHPEVLVSRGQIAKPLLRQLVHAM